MTEAQKKRLLKRLVQRALQTWPIDLVDVDITYRYEENRFGSSGSIAEYKRTTINFNLEEIQSEATAARVVAHELSHYITDPLATIAMDMAEENGSESLKKAVTRANEHVVSTLELMLWKDLLA